MHDALGLVAVKAAGSTHVLEWKGRSGLHKMFYPRWRMEMESGGRCEQVFSVEMASLDECF